MNSTIDMKYIIILQYIFVKGNEKIRIFIPVWKKERTEFVLCKNIWKELFSFSKISIKLKSQKDWNLTPLVPQYTSNTVYI